MGKRPVKTNIPGQESVPAITSDTTQKMAEYRHDNLKYDFKELKPEDFETEEAYRAALLKQYEDLRHQEYDYIVRNEALKAYSLSCDGRNSGINPNNAWGGYHEYPQFLKQHTEHADSAQVQQFPSLVSNPKYMNQVKNIKQDGTVKSVGAYTCAVTSTALQKQVSEKMGYDGKDNIIVDTKCCTSAVGAATCVPKKYQLNGNGKKTLNQMVASGEIGVGDEVSIYPKPDNKKKDNTVVTASGKHCITIASVKRNEKGEVVSFTYQANNLEAFREVDIRDNSGQGGKLVYNAVKTHTWADDKIQEERTNLNQKTTEELAAEVAGARQRTNELIDSLQKTEQYAATHSRNKRNYLSDAQIAYRDELNQRKQACETTHELETLERIEKENAAREAELKQREEEIKKREEKYETDKAEFLKAHPEKEDEIKQKDAERAQITPEKPDVAEIPPATDSQDVEERKRNAMARKEALDKKEDELSDRSYNVANRDTDLVILRQNMLQTAEDKKTKKKAENKKATAKNEQKQEELKAAIKKGETTQGDVAQGQTELTEKEKEQKALAYAEGRGEFKSARADAKVDEHTAIQEITQPQKKATKTAQQTAEQTDTQTKPASGKEQGKTETWEMTKDGKVVKVTKNGKEGQPIDFNVLIERMRQRQ